MVRNCSSHAIRFDSHDRSAIQAIREPPDAAEGGQRRPRGRRQARAAWFEVIRAENASRRTMNEKLSEMLLSVARARVSVRGG
jgi:hypothetical protein